MPAAASVVTPSRYEQGLSYADFVAQAKVNRDKFDEYYRTSPLTDDDIAFFRKAAAAPDGPAKILVIAEAWCGDVYRELPTVARIAEATGMALRVFPRDDNPDIMDEFLLNGKARAIPVVVFYTKACRYLTHFVERSPDAQAELASAAAEIRSKLGVSSTDPFTTFPEADRQAFIKEMTARIVPRFPEWQKQSIVEMRRLLSKALGLPESSPRGAP
jgi:hypothetical protein